MERYGETKPPYLISAEVRIGDNCYDVEDLNDVQKRFVVGKLSEQAMNAAYVGRAVFQAEGIPTYEEAFGHPTDLSCPFVANDHIVHHTD